ncbi:transcription factor GTE8-like [Hibiscus syriacus]|uniref:Transcription factor GTE8-like n=1 Tax=Hibiscus syriacus TaxID=106335 RepID=A0A6A3C288_HIBSY|nr:transcription factor GTE8-like [Hibiscus syriacus]
MDALRRQARSFMFLLVKFNSCMFFCYFAGSVLLQMINFFSRRVTKLVLQAVIKQLGGTGYESSDVVVIDEVEMQRHQQLDKLYRTTRSGRVMIILHFIFLKLTFEKSHSIRLSSMFHLLEKGLNTLMIPCNSYNYSSIPLKFHFSEKICSLPYDSNGFENGHPLYLSYCYNLSDFQKDVIKLQKRLRPLGTKFSEECCQYGDGRKHAEKEQEDLIKLLSSRNMTLLPNALGFGSIESNDRWCSLEDARHLAQRYSRMRQEAEAQLHAAEARMQELKANMAVLGKEAAAALAAVEAQQQRLTVEGEKTYHLRVAAILNEIEAEMVSEKQRKESAPPVIAPENGSEKTIYFLAEATHHFFAESEKELNLAAGDFVVVQKLSPSGWSEGECKGKAGWFPSAYVEKRQRLQSNNLAGEAY